MTLSGLLRDTESWSVLSGLVLPYLIALVNQPHWSDRVRKLVTLAAAVVGGLLTSLATGAFDKGPVTVLGAIGIVLVASQAMYGQIAKKSVRALERKTTPKSKRPVPVEDVVDDPGRHAAQE